MISHDELRYQWRACTCFQSVICGYTLVVAFAFLAPKLFKGGGNLQMALSHSVNEKFSGAETQTPPTVINLNFLHSGSRDTKILLLHSCSLVLSCFYAQRWWEPYIHTGGVRAFRQVGF